ncbi:hypothetical protein FHY55_09970 [Oceanicola sp. D3]|uniref:glycosyltransferase family 8 protein n=1 Tax=Oceanicola sp. D3 TaxID=2587163 RepID=UPI00111F491A|nr:glycosyltransferase [Oceanicola sp. D3]QDC09550.1 hypothetical protein FHY55_09970 [Oceanicola sp. D3]
MGTVNVAYMCDGGFAALTMVSAYSLLQRCSRPVEVTIFLSEDCPEACEWAGRLDAAFPAATVRTRQVDLEPAPPNYQGRLPISSYLRLRLVEFFDRRTLYLDGDTLLRADVSELFDADLGGHPLGGVQDVILLRAIEREKRRWLPFGHKRTGTDQQAALLREWVDLAHYVNTGVLLLDLESEASRARHHAMNDLPAALEFKFKTQSIYNDQDWLNYRLEGDKASLPYAWNLLASIEPRKLKHLPAHDRAEVREAMRAPKLLHFVGDTKPHLHAAPPAGEPNASWWHWFHEELDALTKITGPGVKQALRSPSLAS